jgi:alpha-tubulin suppressor-like RCC1 family protein
MFLLFIFLSTGKNHCIALCASGAVYSWGRNDSGQLGFGDTYMDIYSMETYPQVPSLHLITLL